MLRSQPVRTGRAVRPLSILLSTLAALALLTACGGSGGGGDGGGATASSGSVAVLLTDGPVAPQDFEHIWVTYTEIILIGDPGQVTVYKGEKTIDLRDVEDVSKLVTVGRDVPAGFYDKIRLLINEIELDPVGDGEHIFLSESPNKLPPKIDLNPQERFRVRPGKLLLIQIDIVAGESIHIVKTGVQDKYQFRPVVFVDILTAPRLGKLVLLEGVVGTVDDPNREFDLCGTHPVSRPRDGVRTTSDPEHDDVDVQDHCVEVVTRDGDDPTSYFEEDGTPTDFFAVDEGDPAAVLGRFRREDGDGERLVFEAEVVQLGHPLAVDGMAATEVGPDDRFLIALDPGQPIVSDDPVAVLLQDGSKVFTRRGVPLDPSQIQVDDPVRVTGILDLTDDEIKAAFVMVDVLSVDQDRIEGIIAADPENGGALLTLLTDMGEVCVEVPDDARVFEVSVDAGQGSAEAIDRSELRKDDRLNVFGTAGELPGDCFVAETVISFGTDATVEPLESLAFASGGSATPTSGLALVGAAAAEADEAEATGTTGGLEVYEIEPERVEAGLIWVKLPGDDASEAADR